MTFLPHMLKATELVKKARLKEATDLIIANLKANTSASNGAPDSSGSSANHRIDLLRVLENPKSRGNDKDRSNDVLNRLRKPRVDRRPRSPIGVDLPDGATFLEHVCECPQGDITYKLYVPSGYNGQPLPLLIMLHGCTQDPDDFAAGTRMNAAAEKRNVLVAYPAQPRSANPSKCWNWFRDADQQRGAGEPAKIAAVTRQITEQYRVQSERVFAAGLSAGGAAAAVLGATYPDLYAAIGVHSGLPCGAARDLASAMMAMRIGKSPSLSAGPRIGSKVRTIVFHGDQDKTVNPTNSELVIAQFQASERLGGVSTTTGHASGGLSYTRTLHASAEGLPLFEKWVIHGAGHAWSGGSLDGSFTEPRGPDASWEMLRFFLEEGSRSG